MLYAHDLPSTGMDWLYVWGEILELRDAIFTRRLKNVLDELCDVYTCSMIALHTTTGISLPILWKRTAMAWIERESFWKWYITSVGLAYDVKYLRYGSNYRKMWKRRRAIALAVIDQKGA
jgi:hypothetical protein